VRLFELDLPELFAFKELVLAEQGAQPKCERRIVPANLREDWPARLSASGFQPTRISAWLAEGLLVYLSNDEAARLLMAVHDLSAPTSRLAFDHDLPNQRSMLHQAKEMDGMAEVAAMWQGGLSQQPAQWLRDHGWTAESVAREAFARSCGRDLDPAGAFVIATRT
jgi:methyltransferase (TIGR00027 family)